MDKDVLSPPKRDSFLLEMHWKWIARVKRSQEISSVAFKDFKYTGPNYSVNFSAIHIICLHNIAICVVKLGEIVFPQISLKKKLEVLSHVLSR